MNLKDIKVGEMYNIRVKVIGKNSEWVDAIYADADGAIAGLHIPELRVGALRPISPENGIKNTETAPKYDPCRKGDIVTPKERNGRIPWAKDMTLTVVADESTAGVTVRYDDTGEERLMCVLFLELLTPVEERVRYRVGDFPTNNEWCVWKDSLSKTEVVSSYKIDTHPHAKEAAEAECARLNAEYRKEQE